MVSHPSGETYDAGSMAVVTETLEVEGIRCERCVQRLAVALGGVEGSRARRRPDGRRHPRVRLVGRASRGRRGDRGRGFLRCLRRRARDRRRLPDAVRALRRRARRRAARRPRGARRRRGSATRRVRRRRHRGRDPRGRQPVGRGQPRRRAHGVAARRSAGRSRGSDRQPPVRVRAAGDRLGRARHPGRRRRPVRRGRRRVDDARAARHREARGGLSARRPRARPTRRSAGASSTRGCEERYGAESMGETGENVAERYGVSRADQDAWALRSQERHAAAEADGRFAREIVPVEVPGSHAGRARSSSTTSTRGRTRRPRSSSALRPVFREGGTVTAGNSAGINDGAAAVVLAEEGYARAHGLPVRAALVASAVAGVEPAVMGIGPVPAVRKVLARTGLVGRRPRPRRAQRGVRQPGAGEHARRSASTRSAST